MAQVTPEKVLVDALTDLPEGAFVTGAVVVATYVLPGEDDEDLRGPYLAWRTDTTAGRWTHLGMLEAVTSDLRRSLVDDDED